MTSRKRAAQCVHCGVLLRPSDILPAGRFPCPACGGQLQASSSYGFWIALGNLLFSAAILSTVGVRGLRLLYGVLLAWIPVQYFAINFLKYLIPPRIELGLQKDTTLNLRDRPRS